MRCNQISDAISCFVHCNLQNKIIIYFKSEGILHSFAQ